MVIRIAKRENPDQKQSDLGLPCMSRLFSQANSIPIFFKNLP